MFFKLLEQMVSQFSNQMFSQVSEQMFSQFSEKMFFKFSGINSSSFQSNVLQVFRAYGLLFFIGILSQFSEQYSPSFQIKYSPRLQSKYTPSFQSKCFPSFQSKCSPSFNVAPACLINSNPLGASNRRTTLEPNLNILLHGFHVYCTVQMLGTLSKAFFQRRFSKGDFPSDNFPSGNFTSVQFLKRQVAKGIGHLRRRRLQSGPSAAAKMGQVAQRRSQNMPGAKRCGQDRLGKLHSWEVASGENTLGKLPLGKKSFEKVQCA